jgi:cellulose synthase/poly-beta-1,6-N-acetylglucosamine synthase-like glycosyltransferase/peptidoglycan/xylan/chitin deacetylase (PgdA/CDA1 family)/spore germination protein YaaH
LKGWLQVNQVFFDYSGQRWAVVRRSLKIIGPVAAALLIVFVFRLQSRLALPHLLLPPQHHVSHALTEPLSPTAARDGATRRLSVLPSARATPAQGLRAAFYVTWDSASYLSLRESLQQIDLLFPEWLHVLKSDGRIHAVAPGDEAISGVNEDEDSQLRMVDDKVMPLLARAHAKAKVVPEVNNFDEVTQKWVPEVAKFMVAPAARAHFRQQVIGFLGTGNYDGLMIDFENIPTSGLAGYSELIKEVASDLHSRRLELYVSAPASDEDYPYESVGSYVDGMVIMNYDQHSPESSPGPLASQDWFTQNLQRIVGLVPREKLICGIANYGYDWSFQQTPTPDGKGALKPLGVYTISAQEAWESAKGAQAVIDFDREALNPHFAFVDDPNEQHQIWFTDAGTAWNQMRGAQQLGIENFALWRLGSEDRSLWSIWDHPEAPDAPDKLSRVPPGHKIDYEGPGEVISITAQPANGDRTVTLDPASGLVNGEEFHRLPRPYEASQYGGLDDAVAITFDDGPDPQWTPKVLDILKAEHAPATFFIVGAQASRHPWLLQRIYREGHEIGNHLWSHPDISTLSPRQLRIELNTTERLIAAQLGVEPLLFRPPYAIDVEPEVDEDAPPIEVAQAMGYVTVGSRIDPKDWSTAPKLSAEEIVDSVTDQLELDNGNIILLHDGGGDRQETVRALPQLIHELRDEGYSIVPVARLLGKSRAEIMPPVPANELWMNRVDHLSFSLYGLFCTAVIWIFIAADVLIILRLFSLASLATYNRFRRPRNNPEGFSYPAVAVLVPAYNEEKVIVRTVCSVLNSDYSRLRVIVIDDGSTDKTFQTARRAFARDLRVMVLTKPQGGKAGALNYGLKFVTEEVFLGIDADTVIDRRAISMLAPHFSDPKVAAMAGNTKVGNQLNVWTRWQALEYLTSQNFERRALDVFGVVTVVPGAIGAWRTAAVREAGCYQTNTVAEDADLTMALLERGHKVHYEDRALAYTEAPSTARGLMRQRLRWSFGILQSLWKHRAVFKRGGTLGWVALPNIIVFHFVLPLVSPLVDLIFLLSIAAFFANRNPHIHAGGYYSPLFKLLVAFAVFLLVDLTASALAVTLERCGADRWSNLRLLGHVWLQRFAYRPLFSLVILKTLKRVVEGHEFHWGKLERTAALQCHFEPGAIPVQHSDEDLVTNLLGDFEIHRPRPFAIRVMAEGAVKENP